MHRAAAVGIGVVISLMIAANGALQASLGPVPALVIIHAVGLAAVVPFLWVSAQGQGGRVPWYLFTAGWLGVALLFINNRTLVSLGATLTVSLGIVGQLVASAVIDHFGLFGLRPRPFRWAKLPGYGLIVAGLLVMAHTGQ